MALHASGLADQFQAIVSIHDVRNGKPHPGGFSRALEMIIERLDPDALELMRALGAGDPR